jgi:nucleotidyltransferase substrate binding protein (TIGR01987 family)
MMPQPQQLDRSLQTLAASLNALNAADPASIEYEIYRNAVIKGFELSLEVTGKLLRKALKAYEGVPREVDALPYKEVFRRSAKHGLITVDLVERWFVYRDNRNNTAHDYGIAFAEETLRLLPGFLQDAQHIAQQLSQSLNDN